jgi:sterol 3beta-glucosyltransferase
MNVFIFTLGTRGDVQPYVALARGLMKAGHRAVACASARFASFIREHGIEPSDFNDDFMDLVDSPEGQAAMGLTGNPVTFVRTMRALMKKSAAVQRSMMVDGWKAARAAKPDLIVFHPKAYGGAHFAEKLGVPSVLALAMPVMVPTGEFPAFGFPSWPLGRRYNRQTYRLLRLFMRRTFARYVREWRLENGLSSEGAGRDILLRPDGRPVPVLHAYSRHVAPAPEDWPASAVVTGYWFLERSTAWSPPADLSAFLDGGEPPVYAGFGSMSDGKAEVRTRLVVEAIERAGVRGIIALGWGGMAMERVPPFIHCVRDVPHDWLLPRVAAVVHHGGAGTTAAGLRAGRPSVICPFLGDQPFWGRCVAERGLGPSPIPQKRLTAANLAAAIGQATGDPSIRKASGEMAEKLAVEDGIGKAVRFLESLAR